jgi:translation initiation factor 2B subunit (eIF-2B alpha/beta/delta family)
VDELTPLIAAIADDRESGASEILRQAIPVLRRAMPRPPRDRLRVARALCQAQPGMAPIWNAALAALMDDEQPGTFEAFVQRVERAPAALTRVTRELFSDPSQPAAATTRDPLSLVTFSYSASVRMALETLAGIRPVRIACAEGRPALEGRRLATALAQAGAAVSFFSDAAIGEALHGADAVVVGADAVAHDWIVNKVGTRMLAAAASLAGVPCYAVASRDKWCAPALAHAIAPRDGAPAEIWEAAPAGVVVRNPYLERVSLDLITGIITDGGLVPAANVAEFCLSLETPRFVEAIEQLAG